MQKQPPEVFCKKRCSQNFVKCTVKHLYQRLCIVAGLRIVGTPLIKRGRALGPSKNRVTWGGTKNFAKKEDKPEKGEFIQKWGSCSYFTVQFQLLCCGWSEEGCGGWGGGGEQSFLQYILILQSFQLAIQDCHPSLIVPKHCIICILLIHSDNVQKMLTALFI